MEVEWRGEEGGFKDDEEKVERKGRNGDCNFGFKVFTEEIR
jgi:hypothetical protein